MDNLENKDADNGSHYAFCQERTSDYDDSGPTLGDILADALRRKRDADAAKEMGWHNLSKEIRKADEVAERTELKENRSA